MNTVYDVISDPRYAPLSLEEKDVVRRKFFDFKVRTNPRFTSLDADGRLAVTDKFLNYWQSNVARRVDETTPAPLKVARKVGEAGAAVGEQLIGMGLGGLKPFGNAADLISKGATLLPVETFDMVKSTIDKILPHIETFDSYRDWSQKADKVMRDIRNETLEMIPAKSLLTSFAGEMGASPESVGVGEFGGTLVRDIAAVNALLPIVAPLAGKALLGMERAPEVMLRGMANLGKIAPPKLKGALIGLTLATEGLVETPIVRYGIPQLAARLVKLGSAFGLQRIANEIVDQTSGEKPLSWPKLKSAFTSGGETGFLLTPVEMIAPKPWRVAMAGVAGEAIGLKEEYKEKGKLDTGSLWRAAPSAVLLMIFEALGGSRTEETIIQARLQAKGEADYRTHLRTSPRGIEGQKEFDAKLAQWNIASYYGKYSPYSRVTYEQVLSKMPASYSGLPQEVRSKFAQEIGAQITLGQSTEAAVETARVNLGLPPITNAEKIAAVTHTVSKEMEALVDLHLEHRRRAQDSASLKATLIRQKPAQSTSVILPSGITTQDEAQRAQIESVLLKKGFELSVEDKVMLRGLSGKIIVDQHVSPSGEKIPVIYQEVSFEEKEPQEVTPVEPTPKAAVYNQAISILSSKNYDIVNSPGKSMQRIGTDVVRIIKEIDPEAKISDKVKITMSWCKEKMPAGIDAMMGGEIGYTRDEISDITVRMHKDEKGNPSFAFKDIVGFFSHEFAHPITGAHNEKILYDYVKKITGEIFKRVDPEDAVLKRPLRAAYRKEFLPIVAQSTNYNDFIARATKLYPKQVKFQMSYFKRVMPWVTFEEQYNALKTYVSEHPELVPPPDVVDMDINETVLRVLRETAAPLGITNLTEIPVYKSAEFAQALRGAGVRDVTIRRGEIHPERMEVKWTLGTKPYAERIELPDVESLSRRELEDVALSQAIRQFTWPDILPIIRSGEGSAETIEASDNLDTSDPTDEELDAIIGGDKDIQKMSDAELRKLTQAMPKESASKSFKGLSDIREVERAYKKGVKAGVEAQRLRDTQRAAAAQLLKNERNTKRSIASKVGKLAGDTKEMDADFRDMLKSYVSQYDLAYKKIPGEKPSLNNLSIDQLKIIHDEAYRIYTLGKTFFRERAEKRDEIIASSVQGLVSELTNDGKAPLVGETSYVADLLQWMRRPERVFEEMGRAFGTSSKFWHLFQRVSRSFAQFTVNINSETETFQKDLKAIHGFKMKELFNEKTVPIRGVGVLDTEGNPLKPLSLSPNDCLVLNAAYLRKDDGKAYMLNHALRGGGLRRDRKEIVKFRLEDVAKASMFIQGHPVYSKVAEAFERAYGKHFDEINAIYSEHSGRNLTRAEHYTAMSLATERLLGFAIPDPIQSPYASIPSVTPLAEGMNEPAFTQEVEGGSSPLRLDAMSNIGRHIMSVSRYRAQARVGKEIADTITHSSFKKAVEDVYGMERLHDIYDWFAASMGKGIRNPDDIGKHFGQFTRNKAALALLSWKAAVAMRQGISFIAASGYMGVDETLRGLTNFASHPKEAVGEILKMWPELKWRFSEQDVNAIFQSGVRFQTGIPGAVAKFSKIGMAGLIASDRLAVYSLKWAAYKGALRKGKTETEARDWADYVFTHTQAMSGEVHQAPLWRSQNDLLRAVIMFTNEVNQSGNEFLDILKWSTLGGIRKEGQMGTGKTAWMLFATLILPSIFYGLTRRGRLPTKDEVMLDAIGYYAGGVIPPLRDVTDVIENAIEGKQMYEGTSLPPLLFLDAGRKAVYNLAKGDLKKSFRQTLLTLGYLTGTPTPAVDRYMRGWESMVAGGDVRDIIWSSTILREGEEEGGTYKPTYKPTYTPTYKPTYKPTY